jgi:hypothetical protein
VRCRSRYLRFILRPIVSDGNLLFSERIKVKFATQYDLLHSPTYKSGELKPFTGKVGLPELFLLNPLKSTELLIAAVIPALGSNLLNDPPPRVSVRVNQEQQIQFVTDSEGCLRLPPALIKELVRHMFPDILPGVVPMPQVRLTLPPASASYRTAPYWSAFLQLQSCSHVILVLHIATSLCAMDLAIVNPANPLPGSGNFDKLYTVATCLSRYCLYLLNSTPILMPENVVASKTVLADTIKSARVVLENCASWEEKYDKLLPEEAARACKRRQDTSNHQKEEQGASNRQDIRLDGNGYILENGVALAKELINEEKDEEIRWEILAEVWTDLLLHIAPSSNAESHGKNLTSGVEVITLVWAMLSHCGIEKSKLWPEDTQAGGTIQEHLKRNTSHARV